MRRHFEGSKEKMLPDVEANYLWSNDPGDVNEKVLKMDDEYARTGMHRPNWGKDSQGKEKEVQIPKGKLLDQYSHPKESGSYFTPKDTPYEKLELNDSPDKRKLHRYEVIKDLPATESKVAQQPWNQNREYNPKEAAMQYKTKENAEKLIEQGYLKELPVEK